MSILKNQGDLLQWEESRWAFRWVKLYGECLYCLSMGTICSKSIQITPCKMAEVRRQQEINQASCKAVGLWWADRLWKCRKGEQHIDVIWTGTSPASFILLPTGSLIPTTVLDPSYEPSRFLWSRWMNESWKGSKGVSGLCTSKQNHV